MLVIDTSALISLAVGDAREPALDAFDTAIDADPHDASSHLRRGITLGIMRRLDEALAAHDRAVALNEADAETHFFRGNVLRQMGRIDEAIQSFKRAIEKRHDLVEAHLNLGYTFQAISKSSDAARCFATVLEIDPTRSDAHNSLGSIVLRAGHPDRAMWFFEKALELQPNCAASRGNLGHALRGLGRYGEALARFREAIELDPDNQRILRGHAFVIYYDHQCDDQACADAARQFGVIVDKAAPPQKPVFLRSRGDKLRIGYISGDYRRSSVSYFVRGLFREHDRDRVTLHAYSTCQINDDVTDTIRKSVDHWRLLESLPDDEAASQIERDNLDVLIDLSGHVSYNRLGIFPKRVAPVQAHYISFLEQLVSALWITG